MATNNRHLAPFWDFYFLVQGPGLVIRKSCREGLRGSCYEHWEGSFPGSLRQQLAKGQSGKGDERFGQERRRCFRGGGLGFFCVVILFFRVRGGGD